MIVAASQDGTRLDRLVMRASGVSRRVARVWIAQGRVRVDDRIVRILMRPIRRGARIEVTPAAETETGTEAGAESAAACAQHGAGVRADIVLVHLDNWIIAVNKPANLLTEVDRFGSPALETLVPETILCAERNRRLFLVHRLDAGTSGLVLMARTPMAAANLCEAFREGTVRKTYLALCKGTLGQAQTIDAPIGHAARTRQAVKPDGKPAVTAVSPLATGPGVTLVVARPKTGRTHQIRVHLAHIGHPILGDRLYGGPGYLENAGRDAIGRTMLHALRLRVQHPKTGEPLCLMAPVANDFLQVMSKLGIATSAIAAAAGEHENPEI